MGAVGVTQGRARPVDLVRTAMPRTCKAASAKRIMPEAPIGLDERTPPEQFQRMSPPWSNDAATL